MNTEESGWADIVDAEEAPTPTQHEQTTLKDACLQYLRTKQEIEDAEKLIAEKKAELKELEEKKIPKAFELAGMDEKSRPVFDGHEFHVEDLVITSVNKDNQQRACEWLEEQGFGGIIRQEAIFDIPMGEQKKAAAFLKRCKSFPGRLKKAVNAQTLKKWGRDILTNPEAPELPDFFNVYQTKSTKVRTLKK